MPRQTAKPAVRTPSLVRALLVAVMVLFAQAPPAAAQSCSSDSQCFDFGRPRTYCSGNTLVTKQSICSGTCRSVEISRVPCPGPCVADRCVGGANRSGPIDPPSGSRRPVGVCAKLCICKGKRLTYGLGYAKRQEDCQRRSVDCVYGCSCDEEPRCLKKGEV